MPFAREIWLQITTNAITTLNRDTIGDAGAKVIVEALRINQSITTIELSDNKIGMAGVKDIAKYFKNNKFITTLDLRHNQLGECGSKLKS